MNNTVANFVVGDQVRVVFGAFEGLSGEVLEIYQLPRGASAIDELHASRVNRFLVKMRFNGREFVIDFRSDALVLRQQELAGELSRAQ